jgi:hypothetical protein
MDRGGSEPAAESEQENSLTSSSSAPGGWAYGRAVRRVAEAKESVIRQAVAMRAQAGSDGDVCSVRCELADGICESRDAICEVAAHYERDRRFQDDCDWAREQCDEARQLCNRCDPEERR